MFDSLNLVHTCIHVLVSQVVVCTPTFGWNTYIGDSMRFVGVVYM